ncbi:hypothetical protein F4780DRAFT_755463 [Xylariomycetidae sp. FL0641]|nr:hypothetical protein F4780DRAFT_755463 [Xylariomycetidae sp. FL0641]
MSGIINKVKDAVTGHQTTNTHTSGAPEGTHGPHGRVGNAADPRVDSDVDHRAAPGSTVGGSHGGYTTSGNYSHGTTGHTGATAGHTGATGTAVHSQGAQGPHNSNMLNKMVRLMHNPACLPTLRTH